MKIKQLLTLPVLLLLPFSARAQQSPEEKFNMAMYAVTNMYVDSVDKAKFVDAEIAKMLQSLDPFSEYLPPMTAKANEEAILGKPVAGASDNAPAAAAAKPAVAPASFSTIKAYYMMDKTTGYINLTMFSETTPEEFRQTLQTLKKKGMKNLVLDLRGNGGGLFDAALEVADEFLDGDKVLVSTKGAHIPSETFRAKNNGAMEKGRLVLLVNENTKSAAEIFSAAIRDWDRGVLVGKTTFGKGLIQQTLPFSDGSALRITVARYLTPAGMSIQKPYNGVCLNDTTVAWKSLTYHRPLKCNGGVEADVQIEPNTDYMTNWYALLTVSGVQTAVAGKYVTDLKDKLLKKYPTTDSFIKNFETPQDVMTALCQTAEGAGIPTDKADYAQSEAQLKAQMKAVICSRLYGGNNLYYQLFNANNDVVKRALEVIEGNEYNRILQAK